MDRIGDIYRNLPRRADVIVTTVGARHKCQQDLESIGNENRRSKSPGRRIARRRPPHRARAGRAMDDLMSRAGRTTRARWSGDCATAGRDMHAASRRCCESWPDIVARAGRASCAMLAETLRDGGGATARCAGRWRALLGIGRWSNGVRHTMAHVGRAMRDCAALVARKILAAAPPAGRRSGDVMTAGLNSSRVCFGPFPGSP
ncbi:hypothetical protein F511_10878 [Dorcoceras hygrometricum]|uniref:Uncharacterized protein n=1 Tax=Dorcoceras hygrometricum TaxID=472368 RepID=A0A2Z7AEY7_9LAMI|nr:hypothetical protein F511_10878 [Dorcoceras hygrometricum]